MFGHQDENQDQTNNGLTAGAPVTTDTTPTDQTATEEVNENSTAYLDNITSEPVGQSSPEVSDGTTDNGLTAAGGPATGLSEPDDNTTDDSSINHRDDNASLASLGNNDLLDIKKQALDELSPLVDHLDQTPEEKFKTTMMMIQANDNQALIPEAYKAAKEISDEKARARALLDIVNEINYFTHKD